MAQVTIIIKDQDDGNICVTSEFDPPLRADTKPEGLTDAQHAALSVVQMIREMEE